LFKKIESAIAEVDYLVAILSNNSISSEWVQRELEIALSREIHNKRVFVLPIVIDNCEVPSFLKGRVYADFISRSNYKDSLNKVLQRLGARYPSPPPPPAPEGKTPFALPVHVYRESGGESYHCIGSMPSREDGIYVNMVYLTASSVVVDLIVPGAVYDAYRLEIFSKV
jgi:hypothetical protein